MELVQAAGPLGVRAITGAEVSLDDGSHLTLLCESRAGYRNLCRLLTKSHAHTRVWAQDAGEGWAEKWALDGTRARARERPRVEPKVGEPSVSLADVEEHAEGLVCLSGCARDGAVARRVEASDHAGAAAMARRLLAAFGPDRFRVELQRPFARHDRRRNKLLAELASRLGVPTVATGNVHAHDRSRAALQDAFVAVGNGKTLDESEPLRRGNASHVLASPEAMAERFADHPEAVHESGRIADRLRFDLGSDLGYRYPGSEDPESDRKLAELCRARLDERYAGRRHARAGRGPPGRGAAGDRLAGAERLLPAAPRPARAGPRGGGRGARAQRGPGAAAAGAGEGLQRVVDRLLPDRPLARRPDRVRAAPRALPQRGDHRAARHRPRLPARHPRRAHPARARPLRPRALGAGGRLRHLPGALGHPRPGQVAGAAAGRDRAPGPPGRPLAGQRDRGRGGPGAARRGPVRRAGRRSPAWCATWPACPATSASTRAA